MSAPPSLAPASAAPTDDGDQYPYWQGNMRSLSVGTLFNTLGFTTCFPYMPLIVRELGVTEHLETWVGYVVGAFFLVSFMLGPVWGGFADHFGRKSMVLRAGAGMCVGFALVAMSPGMAWFLVVFMLIGACNGYVPAAIALVATNSPRRAMGRALSTVQSGALIGTTLGPALGAFLAGVLPRYRYLFWVSSGASALAFAMALLFSRERHRRPAEPFRLNLLQDIRIILRIRNMGLLFVLNFMFSVTFFGSTTVVALYTLEMAGGQPLPLGLAVETWVGIVTLALTIASAAALPVWGRLLDRFDPAQVLGIGLGLGVLSLVPFPFVADPLQLSAARVVLGLLAVGVQPAIVRLIKENAPGGMDARALALGTSLQMLGNGGGPFIAGIMAPLFGLRAYFGFNAALLLVGALWWARRGMTLAGR